MRTAWGRGGRGGAMLLRRALGLWWRSAWGPVAGGQRALSTTRASCSKNRRLRQKRALSEKKLFACSANTRGFCFTADQQIKSLSSVLSFYQGFHGERGGSKNCYGANGACVYVKVPVGTLVKEDGVTVADLTQHGEEYVAAYGGAGGKGNRFFLSNEKRAPTLFTPGEPGQERVLHLELKTTAHAGLVGFPNAGKSSLLRALSNAKPAVAAYPFTTLNPHVGIVHYEDYEQVAVADIPGLIRGAHQNRGLGIAFLRHIERCLFLLYVVDLSVSQPWVQLQDLKYELEQYKEGLSTRPCVVIGNKIDLAESRINLPLLKEKIDDRVIALSALTGDNLEELLLHLKELYDTYVKTGQSQGQSPVKW
ncbi:UNVERIFIED_CONTAM: hypothetical protein H355_007476 [Colinus virginianus]|nr:hypothetical protein H355_007476 [Colinus virginianus]